MDNKKLCHSEKAEEIFKSGYNCAQAVVAAFADDYGLDEAMALRIASSFGGGMGRMREVCGAFSGLLIINGLETGNLDGSAEAKKKNYEAVQHLAEEFKLRSGGSIICRELLGLDKDKDGKVKDSEPTPTKRTQTYYKKRPCIELIKDACEIIETEFLNYRAEGQGKI